MNREMRGPRPSEGVNGTPRAPGRFCNPNTFSDDKAGSCCTRTPVYNFAGSTGWCWARKRGKSNRSRCSTRPMLTHQPHCDATELYDVAVANAACSDNFLLVDEGAIGTAKI